MPKICVTDEIKTHIYREFDISDEALTNLLTDWSLEDAIGYEDYIQFRNDAAAETDEDFDYQVCDEHGAILIDWI